MNTLKFLVLLAVICIPMRSFAFTLNIDINGQQVSWSNAINQHNGKVPSMWQPTNGLTPTAKWKPGSFTSPPPSLVSVQYGGQSAEIPIDFVGLEYHIGTAGSNSSPSAGGCVGDFVAPIASAEGVNCYAQYDLTTTKAVTPFAFIRPILNMQDNDLIAAFSGKPAGVYRGSVSVSHSYQFEFGNVLTKRDLSHVVSFQINYEPAYITDVAISGGGNIVPNYDLGNDRVWGTTEYAVNATGWFTNGLRLTLDPARGKNYEMTGPQLIKLPYSINCMGCADSLLVDNGIEIKKSTIVPGIDTGTIQFQIRAEYNTTHSSLESGEYLDQFILIFEPNL